ncbi:BCL-6 corepressor-like protein 1 isoform X2 [Brienomyrus brachyistius]|uniref:BCL-6 corepressor-like protein 1 isoform X2 n=1 Tax=Brienomyrus brachyistius TaxID=42636 RepID=UPI0020B29729|nr:BCL-6 corepressor-like protein 1 isoform X2 [Brienomyrus brachyistius]
MASTLVDEAESELFRLCSSVHGWLDHIRLCTIGEERGVSNTKGNSPGTDLQSPSHKKCVNISHMQVDPFQMHIGDVGREGSWPKESKNMVDNPLSQPLAPECTPDRALSCRRGPTEDLNNHVSVKGSHLKHYLEAPLTYPCSGTPLSDPIPRSAVVSQEAEATKQAENVEVFPTQRRPGEERDSQEVPLNSNLAHPAKKTHTQTQSPRCAQFQAGQSIAFLLQPNLASQLGSITIPSNLDQITVLRKVPGTKFSTECHLKGSSRDMAAEFRPCPQHLTVGRALAPETQLAFKALKPMCCSASTKKNVIAAKDDNLAEDAELRLDAPAPLKQPAPGSACLVPLALTPSSKTCCSSAEDHFTAQNRMPNEKDKCSLNHSDKNTPPSTSLESPRRTEEHTEACPGKVKDIPLDLSSKLKLQKNTMQVQKTLQAGCHLESEPNDTPKEVLQTPASSFVPNVPYAGLSDTMANGALPKNSFTQLNHPVLEPSVSWAKIQIQNTKSPVSLLGTYVGIANPVLASTLRTKDGKGIAFLEDIQDLGRPETISIIDQGEQPLSSKKKGSSRSRQKHRKFSSNTQDAGLQQCQSNASSKVILSTVSPEVSVKGKLSGGKQTVSHSPKSKLPVRHLGASSQSPLKKVEEKVGRSKSSSFKLETVIEQGSLETASNINTGCGHQAATEPRKSEGKCTSFTNERKRDGRQDNCQPGRIEDPETRDSSENSRPTIRLQMSGDLGRIGRGRKELIQVSGEIEKNGQQLVQGLSADSTVDGIGFSILNGQCSGRKISRANGLSQTSSSEKVAINKNKKCRVSKQDKAPKEASRKTTMGIVKHRKKIPVVKRKKQTKKQKNQLAPVLEPKLPEAKGGKSRQGGRCSVTVAEALLHLEAGNVSSLPVLRETAGDIKLEPSSVIPGGPAAPRPRRGRRKTAKVEAGSHSLTSRPATPSPSLARRPRGRPRSNGLSNRAKCDAERAMRRSQRDPEPRKKRKRCRNRRYQNEEYIMEKEQVGQATSKKSTRRAARGTADPMRATPPCQTDDPRGCPKRPLLTRSGSSKCQDTCSTPKLADKPSGKRKFKSKHLGGKEEGKKLKTKRGCLGKRPAPPIVHGSTPPAKRPSSASSTTPNWRGGVEKARTLESPPGRVVPPWVRRLIVNKNAGETLLQRASRLGYEEVVLYCLERDPQELNRRDNAGYTALHKACARGWAHIVQVLLDHGADVNCGAQDGTRPIHDAVVNDNLSVVWMLLNHGADPTLATYSGQTALKLAQSTNMQSFLTEYFADQDGRPEKDPRLRWDFYSSILFETEEKMCWDFLLSVPEEDEGDRGNGGEAEEAEAEEAEAGDCLLFELSDEPHIPCYHIQVSLFQGYCNWFLLTDVLRRLKTSARLFQARYPHFQVVGVPCSELQRQASASQLTPLPGSLQPAKDLDDSLVQLVKCVPDLQRLLGSTVHCLTREASTDSASPCSR